MDRYLEAKLRIKEATDLVALIEGYLPLKPRGKNLIALCPFHAESSPSFNVSREDQFFHCFGCGKSGDVFTWLQERDGLTFREAMEVLADRAGISLEGVWRHRDPEAKKGPDPYQALAEVAAFFHFALAGAGGQLARSYLEGRGLTDAIEPWKLGLHPPAGELLGLARQRNLPLDVLEQAGLFRNGREMFAGRVMFPIDDERGRTVGFGGRLVPGAPGSEGDGDYKPPKYYNSPESPFFNKRRVLFGLHRAKQAGQRRIVVMEGYTDVIACHLAGFTGAVASLGTAFTADHARMVERYATDGLVLMFDGDRAGVQAAERALRELVNSRLVVRIALMSDAQDGGKTAKDPADVVTARAGEDPELVAERRARFADVIDGAEDMMTVWFRLMRRRLDLSQAVHVETAARECAGVLGLVEAPVRRVALLQEMARHLAVPSSTLERLLQKARPAKIASAPAVADGSSADAVVPTAPIPRPEKQVLECILADPSLLATVDVVGDEPFTSAAVTELVAMATDGVALGRTKRTDLLHYLFARAAEQPPLLALLGDTVERSAKIPDAAADLAVLIQGRRRLGNEPRRRALRLQLQQAIASGDRAAADELQHQLLECKRQDQPRAARPAVTPPGPPPSPPAVPYAVPAQAIPPASPDAG